MGKLGIRVVQMRRYGVKLNLVLEWCRCTLDKEIVPDGLYLSYCSVGTMIERAQMRRYGVKLNLVLEWCRYNARQKKCGWAVLKRTAHSHFILLAEVDAPL